jgi:putative phosphoesterase
MLKVAVLADTHIPKRAKALPDAAWALVRSADAIIHAGDVLTAVFLDQLRACAPTYAVRGNNDAELRFLPASITFELERVAFAVVHDGGGRTGREHRMRRLFPAADVVIFGHSHIPWNEHTDGQLLFNPGSPTDRRKQPYCTMGLLCVEGTNVTAEIIRVS